MEDKKIFKEKNFISIIVYLKNNENTIIEFLKNLDDMFYNRFISYEFVLVNDFCTDATLAKIKEIADSLRGNVNVVNLAYEYGIETAMLAGVDFAIGDFVYEFDSTFMDYENDLIFKLYDKTAEGFDVVSASPSDSIALSSKIFYNVLNKISRKNMNLKTETFRIVSRRALNRVLKSKEKIRYRKATYHYSGFNTCVMEYKPKKHVKRNDLSLNEKLNFASDIIVSFSDIGTKLASRLCFLFSIISIAMIIYTIYSYLKIDDIQAGWTTTMMFMSISFTGVFFVLAVISKYVNILLYEVQDKPRYLYKSVDRLSRK